MRTATKVGGRALLVLAILGLAAWAALALALGPPHSAGWALAVVAVGLGAAISAVLPRLRWWPLALFAVAWIAFLVRWSAVQPSNDRDWQTDVAVLPFATFDGDLVTIHNIRNFDYRTETDYTPRYYDKTYDLRQLDSVDLIAVYWMGDAIAHIMASFGFAETGLRHRVDRDAQGTRRDVRHPEGLLPAIRADLRGRRRT